MIKVINFDLARLLGFSITHCQLESLNQSVQIVAVFQIVRIDD